MHSLSRRLFATASTIEWYYQFVLSVTTVIVLVVKEFCKGRYSLLEFFHRQMPVKISGNSFDCVLNFRIFMTNLTLTFGPCDQLSCNCISIIPQAREVFHDVETSISVSQCYFFLHITVVIILEVAFCIFISIGRRHQESQRTVTNVLVAYKLPSLLRCFLMYTAQNFFKVSYDP